MFSKIKSLTFSIILILFSSFFFCSSIKANELETKIYYYDKSEIINDYYEQFKVQMEEVKTYLDNYKDDYYYLIYFNNSKVEVYLYEKKDNFDFNFLLSSGGTTLVHGSTGSTINYISFSFNTSTFETNFTTFKNKLENKTYSSRTNMVSSASTFNNGLIRDTFARVYSTNYDNFRLYESSLYNISINGDILIKPGEKFPTVYELLEKQELILKKESNYSYLYDGANSLKYIDLYFNSLDFNKNINYKLEYYDMNNYNTCGFNCEKAKINSFEIAYLINDNGLYKWVKNNDIGAYIDHNASDISTIYNDNGFILDGVISLNFDNIIYSNIEQIKISIGLSSAFNYTWRYYDNSNITPFDIDEYFNSMLGKNGDRLYRNILYEKYAVFSTNQEKINVDLLNEYVSLTNDKNTNYLYVRYYDTYIKSYIEDDYIVTINNFYTKNRDMEKYNFDIGTINNRGFYIMNYLYHKLGSNGFKFYYFYIPLDLYYSKTDYLDTAIYIDSNNVISNGIVQNPKDENDNLLFSDNFRKFDILISELEETRIFCNDAFNTIYMHIPLLIRIVIEFAFNILCIKVLFEMLGYGDY